MDASSTAIAALALAVLVQIGGIAYFAGSIKPEIRATKEEIRSTREELREHKDLPQSRAHEEDRS